MIVKGIVSTVDHINRTARVIIPEKDNSITFNIPYATHVNILYINDVVALAVFSDSLADALIIAKFPGGE